MLKIIRCKLKNILLGTAVQSTSHQAVDHSLPDTPRLAISYRSPNFTSLLCPILSNKLQVHVTAVLELVQCTITTSDPTIELPFEHIRASHFREFEYHLLCQDHTLKAQAQACRQSGARSEHASALRSKALKPEVNVSRAVQAGRAVSSVCAVALCRNITSPLKAPDSW